MKHEHYQLLFFLPILLTFLIGAFGRRPVNAVINIIIGLILLFIWGQTYIGYELILFTTLPPLIILILMAKFILTVFSVQKEFSSYYRQSTNSLLAISVQSVALAAYIVLIKSIEEVQLSKFSAPHSTLEIVNLLALAAVAGVLTFVFWHEVIRREND